MDRQKLLHKLHCDTVKVLDEAAPNGLKLKKITLHVYNMQSNLFQAVNYDDVKQVVYAFVRQHSKGQDDLICKREWGIYAINSASAKIDIFCRPECGNGCCVNEDGTVQLKLPLYE